MSTYYEEHKELCKERAREYYYKHREDILKQRKEYSENHKEKIAEYKKKYAIENKEKIRKYKQSYNNEHRKQLSEKSKQYQRKRRNDDSVHKFKMQIRHLVYMCFNKKGKIKSKKTEEILGCDLDFFVKHLLETYKNNYGVEWDGVEKVHIDHIIPLASAKTEDAIVKLCYYTNLQLLKAEDNLRKSFKEVD